MGPASNATSGDTSYRGVDSAGSDGRGILSGQAGCPGPSGSFTAAVSPVAAGPRRVSFRPQQLTRAARGRSGPWPMAFVSFPGDERVGEFGDCDKSQNGIAGRRPWHLMAPRPRFGRSRVGQGGGAGSRSRKAGVYWS